VCNGVGDAGALALAISPYLAGLRFLGLGQLGADVELIGDAGTRALAEGRHWRELEELDLDNNAIGDEGALALARSETLAGLRRLNLEGNNLSAVGKDALRARFGDRVRV
jgi:hypothetical protein